MSFTAALNTLRSSRLASVARPAWRALFKKYNDRNRLRRVRADFWANIPEDDKYLEFFRQFVHRGDLVFDIGANVGRRAKVFLQLGARVVAAEPQSSCVTHLQQVLGNQRKLEILPVALSNTEGEAEMMISNASYVSSLSSEHVELMKDRFASNPQWAEHGLVEWSGREMVRTTTLDSLIAEYGKPAFIKIDVEGFEYEVVEGLSTPVALISLEFVAERIEKTCAAIDRINALGAIEGQLVFDDSMEWKLDRWQRSDDLKRSLKALTDIHRRSIGDIYLRQQGASTAA
jgi:FkbM family methyltransferase